VVRFSGAVGSEESGHQSWLHVEGQPPTATVSPYFLTRPRASIIGNHCPR
jgi:hypothetical protein